MKRILFATSIIIFSLSACIKKHQNVDRPKLVVGIVIDQMRWDYLYRYYDRYGNDGFKRLMKHGFNCQNTMLNYLPAYTGPGHTCIYTGSVPSIHGIAANDWLDNLTGRPTYCVDDTTVHLVGDNVYRSPSMSPRNLLVTTITDELRLATNLRSKVFGVAIKDRGSILPAGHLANAAYWYNELNGEFTTSTYYPDQSPEWLKTFNSQFLAKHLTAHNWNLLYPAETYTQSTTDANAYEAPMKGDNAAVFPHVYDTLPLAERYKLIKTLPAGNTLTLEMAKACRDGEKLGQGNDPDFLCISLSSTDYAGHQFGPNSMEIEDMYLRLDQELASFLHYLDSKVGKDNYVLFLTADHGAAHNASFLNDRDIPAGNISPVIYDQLDAALKKEFGKDSLVKAMMNYQVYLDEAKINAAKLERNKVKASILKWFNNRPEVAYTIDMEDMSLTPVPEPIRSMVANGYYRLRSGSIEVIFNPGWYDNAKPTGTTHGTWNPYDTHIPLLWYGWHIPKGETNSTVHMTDIAPTLAALLHIQMPNGCVGEVIPQIVKRKKQDN